MAAPMNASGGPAWANPDMPKNDAVIQEQEFFAPLSTLDEPVMETIMRDVRAVSSKLRVVLLPMDRTVSLSCSHFPGSISRYPPKGTFCLQCGGNPFALTTVALWRLHGRLATRKC